MGLSRVLHSEHHFDTLWPASESRTHRNDGPMAPCLYRRSDGVNVPVRVETSQYSAESCPRRLSCFAVFGGRGDVDDRLTCSLNTSGHEPLSPRSPNLCIAVDGHAGRQAGRQAGSTGLAAASCPGILCQSAGPNFSFPGTVAILHFHLHPFLLFTNSIDTVLSRKKLYKKIPATRHSGVHA